MNKKSCSILLTNNLKIESETNLKIEFKLTYSLTT